MARIDPAFQGAPNLGPTSYDPIAFARRHKMEKFQIEKTKYEEQQRNTAQGLQNLMLDVKGWEDQEGFKEIMADQDKIRNGFLELSRKGMNLVSPKSTEEIMAYKGINDANQRLKQKIDTWTQQKGIYDLYTKAIEADSKLPEDQQKIERESTMANLQKVLKTKGILERGNDLQNLVVTKPEIGDVHKYVKDNMDMITKPDKVQMPYTDPDTGQQGSILNEVVTPQIQKKQVADLQNLYNTAPTRIKNGVKLARKSDPENDPIMTDQDYFVSMYNPKFKQQMINKKQTPGGSGLNINFGKVQMKIAPGELQDNDNFIGGRNYDQRYDFVTDGKLIKVQTTGGFQHDSDPNAKSGDDGWHEITGGDYAEAELLFYDPKTDQLVFRTGQAAQTPWIQNNTTFAVPRKNVPDAEKLPIMVDGKKKTLKDILSEGEKKHVGLNSVLRNSGIKWK